MFWGAGVVKDIFTKQYIYFAKIYICEKNNVLLSKVNKKPNISILK